MQKYTSNMYRVAIMDSIQDEKEYHKICFTFNIVAIREGTSYRIVKHRWAKNDKVFENKNELLDYLAEYL